METKSCVYLLSGAAHAPYLAVSAYTLRQHWDGPICIYSWPESSDIAKQIANDPLINAEHYEREPKYRKKDGVGSNSQFIDKIMLMSSLNWDQVMYLDCDTSIHKPIDPLFKMAENYEFLATQFNNWLVNSKITIGRVSKALGVDGINQKAVQRVLDTKAPSLNGGVFVCRPKSEILDKWYEWTMLIKKEFIADECILHSLIGEYEQSGKFGIAMGGYYNCAPKFSEKHNFIDDKDVAIWHYHGDSCVRPNKTQKGYDLWYPIFKKCLQNNIGNMQNWISSIKNKHLNRIDGWDKWL